jgi:hypothetical protein
MSFRFRAKIEAALFRELLQRRAVDGYSVPAYFHDCSSWPYLISPTTALCCIHNFPRQSQLVVRYLMEMEEGHNADKPVQLLENDGRRP